MNTKITLVLVAAIGLEEQDILQAQQKVLMPAASNKTGSE